MISLFFLSLIFFVKSYSSRNNSKDCFFNIVASSLACEPSLVPYTIDVIYKANAASQSLQVYKVQNESYAFVTSMYGYKKDYRVDSTQICVDSHLYQIICTSA